LKFDFTYILNHNFPEQNVGLKYVRLNVGLKWPPFVYALFFRSPRIVDHWVKSKLYACLRKQHAGTLKMQRHVKELPLYYVRF
jgi:hypothetical protein